MVISTRVAADVLGVNPKQLDNLLVRLRGSLELTGKQGASRQIQVETLELLAVALLIQRDTGAPLRRSLSIARALVASSDGTASLGVLASLRFDMTRLRSLLQQALADALEDRIAPQRGRPRKANK